MPKVETVSHHTSASEEDIRPIKDRILVTDIEEGERITRSGLIIPDDNATAIGIRPRWAKVWKVGPEQTNVHVGEYICIEHGRWTRGVKIATGEVIRMVENDSVLIATDENPLG